MADLFALAANTFSVVGLVDVVSRAAKKVSGYLSEVREAPAELEQLRDSIDANISLIDHMKQSYNELETLAKAYSSPSPLSNALKNPMRYFKSTLTDFDRALKPLVLVCKNIKFGDTWSKVRFVLDKQRLADSQRELDAVKFNLAMAFMLVTRRQDNLQDENMTRLLRTGLQSLTTKTCDQLNLLEQRVGQVQNVVTDVQSNIESYTLQIQQQLQLHHNLIADRIETSATQTTRQFQAVSDRTAEAEENIISSVSARLDNLFELLGRTQIEPRDNAGLVEYSGIDLRSAIPPILILGKELHSAVAQIQQQHGDDLALQQLLQTLQQDYEKLINSAMQEIAKASNGSTATSFDRWICPSGLSDPFRRSEKRKDLDSDFERIGERKRRSLQSPIVATRHDLQEAGTRQFQFQSDRGRLVIDASELQRPSHADFGDRGGSRMKMTFQPSTPNYSPTVVVLFDRFWHQSGHPQLCTQLNTFISISGDEDHKYRRLMILGTIPEIDHAFRTGVISPYGIDKDGLPLCLKYAIWFARDNVVQYLHSQGILFSALKADLGACTLLGIIICHIESDDAKIHRCFKILNQLVESDMLADSATVFFKGGSPILTEHQTRAWRRWVEFWKHEGYDINQKRSGYTPLETCLRLTGQERLEASRVLLENGADVHLQNEFRMGSLHSVLLDPRNDESRQLLVETLCMLIEAGADVNHRDEFGLNPTDYAVHHGFRTEWITALKTCGYNIDDFGPYDERSRAAISKVFHGFPMKEIVASFRELHGFPMKEIADELSDENQHRDPDGEWSSCSNHESSRPIEALMGDGVTEVCDILTVKLSEGHSGSADENVESLVDTTEEEDDSDASDGEAVV